MSRFREFFGLTWELRRVPWCCLKTLELGFDWYLIPAHAWVAAARQAYVIVASRTVAVVTVWFLLFFSSVLPLGLLGLFVDLATMPWQLHVRKCWDGQAAISEAVCAALRPLEPEVAAAPHNNRQYCGTCTYFVGGYLCTLGLTPLKCTVLAHGLIDLGRSLVQLFRGMHQPRWR